MSLPVLELELTVLFRRGQKDKTKNLPRLIKKTTKPKVVLAKESSKTRNGKANVSKEQLEKTGLH